MVQTYQNHTTALQDRRVTLVRCFPMPVGLYFRLLCWTAVLVTALSPLQAEPLPVNFSREVLPILSDRCFHCHGPDPGHRKADLRLDLESGATRSLDGTRPI
ncbi:MAG: hypothetical protein KDN20_24440, partial [Verrucomicrobiae bacterium]|nr:hypothetical protein [Verrucomicrobiae bacterium]